METLPLAVALIAGLDVSAQVVIDVPGNFERNVVRYECEGAVEPIEIAYINAQPNFLAVVPIEGRRMVFVNVIAASGARYVAGQYEWWSKGAEAFFTDLQADDPQPVTCLEHSETP